MIEVSEKVDIKVVGKSWVIELPKDFAAANGLQNGTKVLLSFKDEVVSAEVLPPLSEELSGISQKILKKRRKVFEELKRLGD